MKRGYFVALVVGVNALLLSLTAFFAGAQANATLEGTFSYIYIDDPLNPQVVYQITTESGEVVTVDLHPSLAANQMDYYRQNVRAVLSPSLTRSGLPLVEVFEGGNTRAFSNPLSGRVDVVNLLCQAKDSNDTPFNTTHINTLFGTEYPGLAHYWNFSSHGNVDMRVQTLNWRKMARNASYYTSSFGWYPDRLKALFEDCTAAHDPFFNFARRDYVINIILSTDLLGGYSIGGGSHNYALDGVKQSWRTTWNRPLYTYHSIIAHEMGHSFGFPHSNNGLGTTAGTYQNIWDTMSGLYPSWFTQQDSYDTSLYWYLSQLSNNFHYDFVGWHDPAKKITLLEGSQTVTLDSWAQPDTPNYHTVVVPLADGRMYYIEARNNNIANAYEDYLPGSGVLVYEVDLKRRERAWLAGGTSSLNTSNNLDWSATSLQPGDTFTRPADGLTVEVNSAVGLGFSVTVTKTTANAGMELIRNGSFEDHWMANISVTSLNPWTIKNAKDKAKCAGYYDSYAIFGRNNSSCAMQFKGKVGKLPPVIQQKITDLPNFQPGDHLIFSLYHQTNIVGAKLNAKAIIKFTNGTKQVIKLDPINATVGYTLKSSGLVAVQGLESLTVNEIVIKIKYATLSGKVLVDDVSLIYVPADAVALDAPDTLPLPLPAAAQP